MFSTSSLETWVGYVNHSLSISHGGIASNKATQNIERMGQCTENPSFMIMERICLLNLYVLLIQNYSLFYVRG
jgi:hypothetical protein